MRQEIAVKISINNGELQAIVRRATFREDGKVDYKEGLSSNGWIKTPEKEEYPIECRLPVEAFGLKFLTEFEGDS